MTRTALFSAAMLGLTLGTALPATAGGVALIFPTVTWPESAPTTSTNSKDCTGTVTGTAPAPAPECLPSGQ